jgi:hypothetical protein
LGKSVEDALTPRLSEFESDSAVSIIPHLHKIRDVQYSIRKKTDESTDEAPIYIVRAGARDIGVIRLIPIGDAGFGFSLWEVGSIELLDSFVDALVGSVSITASQNAHVEINGIPVPHEFRNDSEIEYSTNYLIQGIYGDVEVSVLEYDGSMPAPYYAENGIYYFPIIKPFSREFSVFAPSGSNIFVNGELISTEYITDSGIIPEIFIDAVSASRVPLFYEQYEFELDGFYSNPIVTADDGSGNELMLEVADSGEISFSLPFSPDLKARHSATAETFIRAYVSFGANIGNNVDANFTIVSALMLRTSDLFRRTRDATGTMEWTSNVVIRYNSLEIDNFRQLGDEFFSCEIRYDITHQTRYETSEVIGYFEVLFVLHEGEWLAAKMTNIGV